MSTWSFEADLHLLGCGIDAESPARFSRFDDGLKEPWPSVFTPREVAHARSLPSPAVALCAAFCCKEAFVKAFGGQADPLACEVLWDPVSEWQAVDVASGSQAGGRLGEVRARVWLEPDGDCVSVVWVFEASAGAAR